MRMNAGASLAAIAILSFGSVIAQEPDDRSSAPRDHRAEWIELRASVGAPDDPAAVEAWEAIVAAGERLEAIEAESIRAEADARGVSPEDVITDPHSLTVDDPLGQEWIDEAALAATRRAFDAYLEQRAFEAIDRARALGTVTVGPDAQPFHEIRLQWAMRLRRLAMWEKARMWHLLARGEDAAAAEAFENILTLGVIATREPIVIGRLIGLSMLHLGSSAARRAIAEGLLDGAAADAFAAALERRRAEIPPLAHTLEGERLWALGAIDRMFVEDVGPGETGKAFLALLARGAMREANAEPIDRFYDFMAEWSAMPVRARREAERRPEDLADEFGAEAFLASSVVESIGRVVENDDQTHAALDALRIMLALEAHRAEHGAYPATLGALAPECIDAVPEDPFAPDGRWRYRRIEPGEVPGVAMPYVLYSVGHDGEDDGATAADPPTSALYSRGAPGTDFVANTAD